MSRWQIDQSQSEVEVLSFGGGKRGDFLYLPNLIVTKSNKEVVCPGKGLAYHTLFKVFKHLAEKFDVEVHGTQAEFLNSNSIITPEFDGYITIHEKEK